MHPQRSRFPERCLSRRQFGLVLSGGAFLLLAGGTYGVAGRSAQKITTSVATAFGSVAIVRAGRLARLDDQGQPAFTTLAAAASRMKAGGGNGRSMQVRRVSTTEQPSWDAHGHDSGTLGDAAGPEPLNLTWADVVLLEVQLQNAGPAAVLFSPGQLRLRLGSSAVTVTPRDSDRDPGPMAPHSSEHLLISYLAPRDAAELELDYSDEQQDRTYPLALPPLTTNEARS
jgi:hypothetical protein